MTELKKEDLNKEQMTERIEKALARYEASRKTKQRKRKSFKIFSLDDCERKSREKVNSPRSPI